MITTTDQAMDLLKVTQQQIKDGQRGMAAHNLQVIRAYFNGIHGLKTQIQWMVLRKVEKAEKALKATR